MLRTLLRDNQSESCVLIVASSRPKLNITSANPSWTLEVASAYFLLTVLIEVIIVTICGTLSMSGT